MFAAVMRQGSFEERVSVNGIPSLSGDGHAVALYRNPYPVSDDQLYAMLRETALEAQAWIGSNADLLFPESRAFMALTILAGPEWRVSPKEALLAIVMVGTQANVGHSLEQAWAKAARHWESGTPNGSGIFLGADAGYAGDCNWGLSDECDGFIFGAEGMSQFPARHAGRMVASSLAMRLVVARHAWNNDMVGRNLSVGRAAWLTGDGRYAGQHDIVRELRPVMGEIPAR